MSAHTLHTRLYLSFPSLPPCPPRSPLVPLALDDHGLKGGSVLELGGPLAHTLDATQHDRADLGRQLLVLQPPPRVKTV